jgi:hypothetical protein
MVAVVDAVLEEYAVLQFDEDCCLCIMRRWRPAVDFSNHAFGTRVQFDCRHLRVKWIREMRVIYTEALNTIKLLPVVHSANVGGTRIPRSGSSVNLFKHEAYLTYILKFSSYLKQNAVYLFYKYQLINDV